MMNRKYRGRLYCQSKRLLRSFLQQISNYPHEKIKLHIIKFLIYDVTARQELKILFLKSAFLFLKSAWIYSLCVHLTHSLTRAREARVGNVVASIQNSQ